MFILETVERTLLSCRPTLLEVILDPFQGIALGEDHQLVLGVNEIITSWYDYLASAHDSSNDHIPFLEPHDRIYPPVSSLRSIPHLDVNDLNLSLAQCSYRVEILLVEVFQYS